MFSFLKRANRRHNSTSRGGGKVFSSLAISLLEAVFIEEIIAANEDILHKPADMVQPGLRIMIPKKLDNPPDRGAQRAVSPGRFFWASLLY